MRWLGASMLLLAALTAGADAKPSNPAFLGIGMQDASGPGGPCMVTEITRGSGAKAAGVQRGDFLAAIDGTPVPNCDAVLRAVQNHNPGDTIPLAVIRGGRALKLEATLVSRDEIMRRRLVGQPMVATDLYAVDDQRSLDLSELHGKTTIVGWFDARYCDGCVSLLGKIGRWTEAQADKPGYPPEPLAVIMGEPRDAKQIAPVGLDVPLAIADQKTYEELVVPDRERINFMVIDCRGVVRYVAPIMPTSDDAPAALDELFAAAEQASSRAQK